MRSMFIITLVLGLASGQALARTAHKSAPASGSRSLVQQLRTSDLTVESAGTVSQPFFTPKGRVYRVNGDDLQLYEYRNETAAVKEAGRVSQDGSISGSMPMWIAPPHFFRKDRVIAIYLGTNAKVVGMLARSMGPQFAGRP